MPLLRTWLAFLGLGVAILLVAAACSSSGKALAEAGLPDTPPAKELPPLTDKPPPCPEGVRRDPDSDCQPPCPEPGDDCQGPGPGAPLRSREVSVQTVTFTYAVASPGAVEPFVTGQATDIMPSGFDFNDAGGPLTFNHQGGIASDGVNLAIADRNNNRVLVWNHFLDDNEPPNIVLGQDNFRSNAPGDARDGMNWSVSVAMSGGRHGESPNLDLEPDPGRERNPRRHRPDRRPRRPDAGRGLQNELRLAVGRVDRRRAAGHHQHPGRLVADLEHFSRG